MTISMTYHPHSQGVTYFQHWAFAMGIAWRLLRSVMAFALHAVLPFITIKRRFDLEATSAFLLERNHFIQTAELSEEDLVMNQHTTIFRTATIGLLLTAGLAATAVAQLPDPGMTITQGNTALVITDPQNDFLSPKGVTWGVVGESVTKNNTVANIESLMKAAKEAGIPVFVSPHYYYPTDKGWQFEGALETLMHAIGMFDRTGQLDVDGFENSGADWLARYKPLIDDGQTIIAGPHKVYGPENNDLLLQLRKRGIDKVILAGMSANLCTEAHLRELLERGFEVAVVKDGTAAAIVPEGNGYEAALVNFRFMANDVIDTRTAVAGIKDSSAVAAN